MLLSVLNSPEAAKASVVGSLLGQAMLKMYALRILCDSVGQQRVVLGLVLVDFQGRGPCGREQGG